MKKVISIILIVLIILLGVPYLYLRLSTARYDEPETISGEIIMPSSARFTVDSSAKKVDVRLDKSDIYRIISDELGESLPVYLSELTGKYGIEPDSLGFFVENGGISLNLHCRYKNFLPLPLNMKLDYEISGSKISVALKQLYIGNKIGIKAPVLLKEKLRWEYDFTELNPFFKDISALSLSKDGVTLSIPYPLAWIMAGIDNSPDAFTMIFDFVDADEFDTPVPALFEYFEGNQNGMLALIDACAQEPAKLIELKCDMMGICGSYTWNQFFRGSGKDTNYWLFPEITEAHVAERGEEILGEYQALYDERTGMLDKAYQYFLECYAGGLYKTVNGVLADPRDKNSPVSIESIGSMKNSRDWLDLKSVRVIFVTNPGDYAMNQIPKGNTSVALILRTRTGRPVAAYKYLSNYFKIKTIDESDYTAMMKSKTTPKLDLGEHTTQRR